MRRWLAPLLTALLGSAVPATAAPAQAPRVLVVDAHPDDESAYAATIYKITHDLGGTVDLAVITNGEGGYKYSTLAEGIYHRQLTDPAVGRRCLPGIRRRELLAAGRIIGLHKVVFFGEKDHRYTRDEREVLDPAAGVWRLDRIRARLRALLDRGHYGFVFTLLPTEDTHGHHKAATLLALEAVQALPEGDRPVVLGADVTDRNAPPEPFTGLAGYPQTRPSGAVFTFDRTQGFGYRHVLTYRIIVDWLIAEHKSQGTMQLAMNHGDLEQFWAFAGTTPAGEERARDLFRSLAVNRYPELDYPNEVARPAIP